MLRATKIFEHKELGDKQTREEKILEMAQCFHENYVQGSAERLPPNMRPWKKLDDTFRTANIEQAKYAFEILDAAGFGVRPAKGEPVPFVFWPSEFDPGFLSQPAMSKYRPSLWTGVARRRVKVMRG